MALSSRLAIIVGGLGGLGTVTGKLLLSKGARLALLYAPFEKSRVATVLSDVFQTDSSSDDVKTYECDITSAPSVQDAFAQISADNTAFPSILINTAGHVNLTPLEDFPLDDIVKHYNVNLLGPTLTAQAFAKLYFAARAAHPNTRAAPVPGGRIINLASQAAHVALKNHGPYCASKAGLIGLTKCMASEWAGRGITANTISPGPVMTELGKKAWPPGKDTDGYLAAVPTGVFAEPAEVANVVEFLCRDESRNVNGVDVRLDGGFTVR